MHCCITDLRNKDVINKKNGCRLGNVVDVQVDSCTGAVVALVVCVRPRAMGLFAPREECFVRWEDVAVIGDDTILVNFNHVPHEPRRKQGFFG